MGLNKSAVFWSNPEARAVSESIQGAFDENGSICFNALKNMTEAERAIFPQKLREKLVSAPSTSSVPDPALVREFNQLIKRQQPHNPFSSPLDRFSPQWYQHYVLVAKPLIRYRIELVDESEYANRKRTLSNDDDLLLCKIGQYGGRNGLYIYALNGLRKNGVLQYVEQFIPASEIQGLDHHNIPDDLTPYLPQILEITSSNELTRCYEQDRAYLSLNLERSRDGHAARLNYSMKLPDGEVVDGQLDLGNCFLVRWDEALPTVEAMKGIVPFPHQAIIQTPNGTLHWFHDGKIVHITPNEKTKEQYNALYDKIQSLNLGECEYASRAERERISAILPSKEPITFEIDRVIDGLAKSRENQYDGKLDGTITRIQREALNANASDSTEVEAFNRDQLEYTKSGRSFLDLLRGEIGQSALDKLSNYELFRYYMAYVNIQKNPGQSKLSDLNEAFAKATKRKILQDTIDDLNRILSQSPPIYPKETIQLADIMMDKIRLQDDKKTQICDLRDLRDLLRTSWAMGTALTQGVDSEPLTEAEQTIAPYAERKVSIRQALPFDENMPNYSAFKDLLGRFESEVRQYNAKTDESRARAALRTKFFVPKDEASWKHYKRTERNCLILYDGKLYHINSDKTLSVLMPLDIQQAIWGAIVHDSQQKMHDHIEVKYAPPSKTDKAALDDHKMFLIHHERTNSYTIGYKQNGQYTEKPLKALLGENVPFDPSLASARQTLETALHDKGVLKYGRSVLAQMPKAGKYFSFVHQGKVGFHKGYVVEELRLDTRLEKGKIYLYHDQTNNQIFYSIIAPNGEIIRQKPLKTNIPSVQQLNEDKALTQAIINEIAENGHAYKKSGMVYDPHTMLHKLRTETGYQDAMRQYRVNREKQRTAYRAMRENMKGGWSAERREAMVAATRMARGELTSNGRLRKRECGIALHQTEEGVDLLNDQTFKEKIKGKGQDMYYLHMVPDGADLKPIALYFIDRSGDEPVVTKVEAKETEVEKSKQAGKSAGPMDFIAKVSDATSAAKPKADQSEFYQNLYAMLKAAAQPESVSEQQIDDPWIKFGLNHAGWERKVHYFEITEEENKWRRKEIDNIILARIRKDEVLVIKKSTGPNSSVTCLYYRDAQGQQLSKLLQENEEEDLKIIRASRSKFSPDDIHRLNRILEEGGSPTRIPIGSPTIAVISPELDEAINAETKDVRLKGRAYDEQLERYAHDEVSNQLSYVLAQRAELRERYEAAQSAAISIQEQTPDDLSAFAEERQALLSPLNKQFTSDVDQKLLSAEKQRHLSDLNQELLAEQYQIRYLDAYEHERLMEWMRHPQGEPPVFLEKGVLYLYRDGKESDCLSLDPFGTLKYARITEDLFSIDDDEDILMERSESQILKKLLLYTEAAGITLPARWVDPNFLARCSEAQRFLDKMGRGGWFSSESVLPQENRDKLMRMMTEIAIDPDSKEAKHYLRDHHMMYITSGRPANPNPGDKDLKNFYLDVNDPNNPVVYRFVEVTNRDGVKTLQAVVVELENYYTSTPGKELYKIARAKLGKNPLKDETVELSGRDVYYHITCQSKEALKMGTAIEMIEEIYQREFGLAKVLENAAFSVMAAGIGLASLFMGNVAGVAGVWAMMSSIMTMFGMGAAFLASLVCARAAVVNNGWFDGGLSELKQKIADLETLKLGLREVVQEEGLRAMVVREDQVSPTISDEDDFEEEDLGVRVLNDDDDDDEVSLDMS